MSNGTTQDTGKKAVLINRMIALIIDALIAGVIGFIPLLGGIIGTAYMLLRDGFEFEFMDHRSVGKKLMKLRPIRLDGGAVDLETSVKRNWMFAFGALAQTVRFVPLLGGLFAFVIGLAALAVGIMEIVFTVKDPEGRRWGDYLANTKVIEVEK
jgi:uncharacterized RDD family membrane protein YckC